MTEDLDYPARQGEEAIRQLSQLRVTLEARIAEAKLMAGEPGGLPGIWGGKWLAYRDVLTLLGPEPAWTTDNDGEPF